MDSSSHYGDHFQKFLTELSTVWPTVQLRLDLYLQDSRSVTTDVLYIHVDYSTTCLGVHKLKDK